MYYAKHLFICINQKSMGKPCCANEGGASFASYLKTKLITLDLHGPGKIRVSQSSCLGRCAAGPCMVIYPEGIWYRYTNTSDIDEIIAGHLLAGKVVAHLLIPSP